MSWGARATHPSRFLNYHAKSKSLPRTMQAGRIRNYKDSIGNQIVGRDSVTHIMVSN